MDLTLTPAEEAIRHEARTWLATHAPRAPLPSPGSAEGFAAYQDWERTLAHGGWSAVSWPEELGGRALDPLRAALFFDEYAASGAPLRISRFGLGLVGASLRRSGTPEQQERWLAATARGDLTWCQGFSEPGAGSDLASLRTRGEVTPDGVIVTGQKVWTSHGTHADLMFALIRTEPGSIGHRGITAVVIDMQAPGVTVRPIEQINGQAEFCEVFLDEVQVPMDHVVGGLGDGWNVAMSLLGDERLAGQASAENLAQLLREAIAFLPDTDRDDAGLAAEVGRLVERIEAYRWLQLRSLSEHSLGREVGRQALVAKLWWSETQLAIAEFGLRAMGQKAALQDTADEHFQHLYWYSRSALIFAGTNEIQRNIIAERGLGLPREARGAS
ncbi:MAG: acyl-CoA dehydrogenase family protein [Phycicoccus sp.]|nr:acyl-CoA dehydrogenase family protein [Phycicoccus sp.]